MKFIIWLVFASVISPVQIISANDQYYPDPNAQMAPNPQIAPNPGEPQFQPPAPYQNEAPPNMDLSSQAMPPVDPGYEPQMDDAPPMDDSPPDFPPSDMDYEAMNIDQKAEPKTPYKTLKVIKVPRKPKGTLAKPIPIKATRTIASVTPNKKISSGFRNIASACPLRATASVKSKEVGKTKSKSRLWVEKVNPSWYKVYRKVGVAYINSRCIN